MTWKIYDLEKNLPVRYEKSIKAGTKMKNIKLAEGDYNIDFKIDGFVLKWEFVKKTKNPAVPLAHTI